MRWLLALVLLAPLAAAGDPYPVVVDWTEGSAPVGTLAPLEGVNAVRVPLDLDACHRRVLVDLLYDPASTPLDAEGVGEVDVLHTFRADLFVGGALVGSTEIREPGYGRVPGVAPGEGPAELRLAYRQGGPVAWDLRVRAAAVPTDPDCGSDV